MSQSAPAVDTKGLPRNAYTPLPPGERYQPIVPASERHMPKLPPEGRLGTAVLHPFTVASAYSGLKVGQVTEAAIPISILTIGLVRTCRRRTRLPHRG